MSRTRTLWRSALVLGTAAVSAVSLTAPAQALVPPDWAAGGYLPSGCALLVPSGPNLVFADTALPRVRSLTFVRYGEPIGRTLVVGPSGVRGVSLGARVTSECAGAGVVVSPTRHVAGLLWLRGATGALESVALERSTTSSAWDTTWYANLSMDILADTAGDSLSALLWSTAPRYGTFTLDLNGRLVSSTAAPAAGFAIPGLPDRLSILRQTTLALTASSTRVRRGATVRFVTTLRRARMGGYQALGGVRVTLMRRYGANAWRTAGSATTTSAGLATFSVPVTRATQFRATYAGATARPFFAPSTSATRIVALR